MATFKCFPRWWNARKASTRELLEKNKIYTTADLIRAVDGHRTNHASKTVSVRISNVLLFCDTQLDGMKVYIPHALNEAGVYMKGRKPHTLLFCREPGQERAEDACKEEEEDIYNWDTECMDSFPPECYCPITHEVFEDPVVAGDGYTYERCVISEWFARDSRSPITNEPLTHTLLIPNRAIREQILRLR